MSVSSEGLRVAVAGGEIVVTAQTGRAIRVRFFGPPVVPDASYVHADPRPAAAEAAGSTVSGRRVERGAIAVEVGDAAGTAPSLTFFTRYAGADRPVLATAPPSGVLREAVTDAASGASRQRVVIQLLRSRAGYEDDVHLYGLGQGGGAQLDRLGTSRVFWNSQVGHGPGVDFGVPLLVASAPAGAYGLFFDTAALARLDTARGSGGLTLRYEAEAPSFDLYFLAGPTAGEVLEAYAELTGFPALPPRWALGFLQSTRFFETTQEIVDLGQTFREKGLPCDALIFLSTYGHSQGWNGGVGKLDFHPALWPDPAATMRQLQDELHFRVVTHEYPVLHPDAAGYAEADRRGFLLDVAYPAPPPLADPVAARASQRYAEDQRFVDFTNPAARSWWWEQHRHLVELGVAGWWLDGGEGPSGPTPLHGGDVYLLHNVYDLNRFRAFAEGEARDRPDGRPWMLCRSGAAGMQALGAASWSGDINTTFTTFEAQVVLGLGLAMSGVPYWGTDIGGFYPAALDGELYARWFQTAAFWPLFRAHGWELPRHFPWAHGPEVEAICKRYLDLRMRLLPYLYTLAWEAHTRGQPLLRPLALHFPDDPNVWELGSQFMLGPDLLVAPVTRAGVTAWPVYLPAGDWYDFWTGERHAGGRAISAPAPLDTIPLFVRGGAVLPLGPVMQRTDEQPLTDLTLWVYPGPSRTWQLYEDDGASQAYRAGQYALTDLRAAFEERATEIDVQPRGGEYAGQPAARDLTFRVRSPAMPREVGVRRDGAVVAVERRAAGAPDQRGASWWSGDGPWTWVRVPGVGRTERVTARISW